MRRSSILAFLLLPSCLLAQTAPTSDLWQSCLANLQPRSIGPTNMGGRIVDLAVYNKEPRIFYVASASGGLWKTENGGITMTPTFDHENSVSLGACAVNQSDPNDVWVGSGEGTSRNSVAWGDGVYHSTDGGKTWKNMGLGETMHISRIIIDPKNKDTVYVGAQGRLWGSNPERGLYKTTDGGQHWNLILKVDEHTGVADLQMNPQNPNELLCAMWPRERKAWDFVSGGPGSGLYKTSNGGRSWKKLTKGLPQGIPGNLDAMSDEDLHKQADRYKIKDQEKMSHAQLVAALSDVASIGRIGISYYARDPKIVMATVEYVPPSDEPKMGQTDTMNRGGTYMSKDGGESWARINSLNPRPFYFSRPQIDPNDEKRLYINAVNLHASEDGGKTFRTMPANIHADIHAMWINPADSNHILIGCDGGVYQSRDRGVKWEHLENMPIGQFYAVCYDMRTPYWVYGGLQDNGSWGNPTQTSKGVVSWYDSVGLGGGDGFHVASDPEDWRWFYSESQGGALVRYDLKEGGQRFIRPREQGLRMNWSTPFILSPWNSSTLYYGANKVLKSVDRGSNWRVISPDLTTNNPAKLMPHETTGAEQHCTIISMSESRKKQGLIYVGTDDGLVWVTQDDGAKWDNITANIPDLPANTWCSRVLASKFVEGRVYATFDGHRSNDFKPYAYVSEDFGKTWKKLNSDLPDEDSIYVILEGEKNQDLLFLGSEKSLRVSLDRGQHWTRMPATFPTVAVHDLVIQPREGDLVIGTHGRSIWTMDINGLEALTADNLDKDVVLAKPQNVYLFGLMTGTPWDGDQVFQASNTQPGTLIQYFLKNEVKGGVKVMISSPDGERVQELSGSGKAGLNVVRWNGRVLGRPSPGDFRISITVGGKEYLNSVRVSQIEP